MKRQIKDAIDVFRREHAKYMQVLKQVEDLKIKRDDTYKKYGLAVNEMLQYENMPREIKNAEQRLQEGLYRLNDAKKTA